MKKIYIAFFMANFLLTVSLAQSNSNPWPITGSVGIGSSTPNFNLHLHGTTNYSVTFPATIGGLSGGTAIYGITSRLGLTNTNTGLTNADGLLIRMSALNATIENLEKQDLTLSSGGSLLRFSGANNRIWAGSASSSPTSDNFGYFNVIGSDNGLYVQSNITGKYGLSIKMNAATDNAIQVMGFGATTTAVRNFAVKANGEVFARKYTTTLTSIPDYVFKSDYNLMPLDELRTYIKTNSHLPNIPSAQEYAKTGVDLGELNRLLLEKVEELTLYILQLEERMKSLEAKQ